MKFHWGHGILIFYVLFAASLVVIVVKSRGFDNSLVTEAYYQRDLNYQAEYERRVNSLRLEEPLRLGWAETGLTLQFPSQVGAWPQVQGDVQLYRPSGRADDRTIAITTDVQGRMPLDVRGMRPGRYVAVVDWTCRGVGYYDEIDFTIKP